MDASSHQGQCSNVRRSTRIRQQLRHRAGTANQQPLNRGQRPSHEVIDLTSEDLTGHHTVHQTPMIGGEMDSDPEAVDEDDICPICQLLLYRPVTTNCNHTLCELCMATWADVSVTTQMEIVDVDEPLVPFNAVSGLEARCPMCRTQTSATPDAQRAHNLRTKYPITYAERESEDGALVDDNNGSQVQTLTLNIGNRHRLINPFGDSPNQHEWNFFVLPSRTGIIEEVHIQLHPTFRPPRVVRTQPPYEVRRIGWGHFTIVAFVILKAGYSWVSQDAEPSPDGVEKGMLGLEWQLDFERFDGRGSMGRLKLKVRNQIEWIYISDDEEEDERARERFIRQYNRDGIYVPDDET